MPTFKFRECVMGGVGTLGRDQFSAPVIPFPDKSGISFKRFGRGQIFRAKISPQSVCAAKRGDPTVCGNAGSCEHHDASRGGKLLSDENQIRTRCHRGVVSN